MKTKEVKRIRFRTSAGAYIAIKADTIITNTKFPEDYTYEQINNEIKDDIIKYLKENDVIQSTDPKTQKNRLYLTNQIESFYSLASIVKENNE